MDNLESQTYEVFEKDPIKYSLYQQAVYAALLDKVPETESLTQTLSVSAVQLFISDQSQHVAFLFGCVVIFSG